MVMLRCSSPNLFAVMLLGLVVSHASAGEAPAEDSNQPKDAAGTAEPTASEAAPVEPMSTREAPAPPADAALGSPTPAKGGRPNLGLCDGS